MIKKILEIYHMWNVLKSNDNSNIHENLSSLSLKKSQKLNVSFDNIFRSLNANV